jgi:hypothetical protein
MAQQVPIAGAGASAKIRSPWAPALLPWITFVIYLLFWWYYINRELRDYGKAKQVDLGMSPRNSVLALAVGWIIIVPPILSTVRTFKRIQFAQKLAGVDVLNGWIGLVLYLVLSPAFYAYMQSGLNNVWRAQAQ